MSNFIELLEKATLYSGKKIVVKAKDAEQDRKADEWVLDYEEENPGVKAEKDHIRNAYLFGLKTNASPETIDSWIRNTKKFSDAHGDYVWELEKEKSKKAYDKFISKVDRVKKEKTVLTRKQFEKMAKEAGQDFKADNPDEDLQQVAYDLAASMLYNKDVYDFMRVEFETTSKEKMTEILADYIYG